MRRVEGGLPLHGAVETLCEFTTGFCQARIAAYDKLGFAPGFHERLRRHRPSLIHAHFAFDGLRASTIAKNLKIPLLVTLHGYDVTKHLDYGPTFSGLWQQASRFLCVSEYIKRAALKAGFPAEKLMVQYIGIDLDAFPSREQPSSESPPTVLFVGRLAEKKGCIYLIRAMAEVRRAVPDATLLIIGDGPQREALERESTALGVEATFAGRRNPAEIRVAMSEAAIFCAPSIEAEDGDSEGLGMVFLEAQATELPVVSTNHGGIPEAIRNGVSGLLAEPKDAQDLARCILEYLQNPRSRDQAGVAGRKFVIDCFDLKHRTTQLEQIYRDVIAGR
nr:glycosyltransferase [Granulicella aggregans]